jgi:desumoylating isopeptidase 1
MFLVGVAIPDRITSLPQTVLNSPFGQIFKTQLENSIRGITQAPVLSNANMLLHESTSDKDPAIPSFVPNTNSSISGGLIGVVHNVTKLHELEDLLEKAKTSCAVVFFTSATCPHCKIVYPAYDELATEFSGQIILVKVDLSQAYGIASRYEVGETPRFMTFLQGEKESEWSGANERQLRGNIRILVQMAHPPHPHTQLKLFILHQPHDVAYIHEKRPSLDKLVSRLGSFSADPCIMELKEFVNARPTHGPAEVPLPHLPAVSALIVGSIQHMEPVSLFPIIDLFRLALIDPRVSGYFAEEPCQVAVSTCLQRVVSLGDKCPYALRVVTLYLSTNLFSSPLFPPQLLGNAALSGLLIPLITSSLLDTSPPPIGQLPNGQAVSFLAYNVAAFNRFQRLKGSGDVLPESSQIELMAGLLEALRRKKWGRNELRGLLLAVGLLVYSAPLDGELADLCRALDAKEIVRELKGLHRDHDELAEEVEMVIG